MSLLIQDRLRQGVPLDVLVEKYALIIKRGTKYPNLVLFKYDQISSPMDDPLVCQCRGVILDETDNWRCVSRPFDKFWNYGEGRAATIDWASARVQNKADGSLMQLYFYRGGWEVGTSGTPDASGAVNGSLDGLTYRQLFWDIWVETGMPALVDQEGARGITLLFELTAPENRIVVQHKARALQLIGARKTTTGQEYHVRRWTTFNPVREFDLSQEKVFASLANLPPLEQEGYVIVDQRFNRVKVKSPAYVALHHLRDNLTPKGLVEVVRRGEVAEVVVSFPEWKEPLEKVQLAYDKLVLAIAWAFYNYQSLTTQKDFALRAVRHPWSGVLFALRKGTVTTPQQALRDARIERLVDWLQLGGTDGTQEGSSSTGSEGAGEVSGPPLHQVGEGGG